MTDEFEGGVKITPQTIFSYASWSVEMKALLTTNSLWKCTQIFAECFMITLGALTLKEKDEIETKFDKALVSIECFLNSTSKMTAKAIVSDKKVSKTIKDQLKVQESYTKMYLRSCSRLEEIF